MSVEISSTAPLLSSSVLSQPYLQGRIPSLSSTLPKLIAPEEDIQHQKSDHGLQTPPLDDMSAAYHPAMPAYDGHHLHAYPMPIPNTASLRPTPNDVRISQQNRFVHQRAQTNQGDYGMASQEPDAASLRTPLGQPCLLINKSHSTKTRRSLKSLIYHSVQLPKCISESGGSLSDFAAQMTCLFWFQSIDDLKHAEMIRSRPSYALMSRLPALARPHEQFQKWVYNVLSTTQVTQNVVLLALLFIYRLKMSTPQIKGRAGSEYRLLTVALMLGNKFLDDNTYTNKTWAEVSSFSVQEIHVMEVEFLSNMRYNLLASENEWEQWLETLSCFHDFYKRASRLTVSPGEQASPLLTALHSPPFPSPTSAGMPSFTAPVRTIPSPVSSQHQHPFACQPHANITPPLVSNSALASRKRSPDGDLSDHPAKRQMHATAGQPQNSATLPSTRSSGGVDQNRMVLPQLTLVTNQPHGSAGPQQEVVPPCLPPMQSGTRAMSAVYPSALNPGLPHQHAAGKTPSAASVPPPAHPAAATYATPTPIGYGTPTKHQSPGRRLHVYGSSPLVEGYAAASAVHTPAGLTPVSNSPSVYLQHRASPYKPIRHVNRLLCPPSSASLDQYHFAVPVQQSQMHYQPLGRRNELRSGVVPEFLGYDGAQQQQQQQQQRVMPSYPHY